MVEIYNRYSEPQRHYHTFRHIAYMLEKAKDNKVKLNYQQELAILFHDIVYDIGAKDNEEKSVKLFRKINKKYHLTLAPEMVAYIIMSTKNHVTLIEEAKIVIDLDLSCLCELPCNYNSYAVSVFKEYENVVNIKEYISGRIKFLENMLAKEKIFCSNIQFCPNESNEEAARKNMKSELAQWKDSSIYKNFVNKEKQ